jgi:transposase
LNDELAEVARRDESARRLATIPGVGVINATALVAAIGDGTTFAKGRDLSAWLGLVPRQHKTGGKTKLLGISKRGKQYLRRQLIHGARSVLLGLKETQTPPDLHRRAVGGSRSPVRSAGGAEQMA